MLHSPLRLYSGVVLVVIIIGALLVFRITSASSSSDTIEVKWLLSHQPVDVFARSTEVFAAELSKRSEGRLVLKVVTPQEAGYGTEGDIPNTEVMSQLESGKVQLASVYTVALGKEEPAVWSLTLPYLFDSYAQTGVVLDGPIGQQILNSVANSSVRALAFTMSGGYRIIASKDTQIRTPEDMKGIRIATSGGPIAEATLKALGAIPVSIDLESGSKSFDPATINAVETTYSRLGQVVGAQSSYTTYLNETNHSMFLTAILSSTPFYDSLSPNDRQALHEAALVAAAIEREDSIALAEEVRTKLQASGSTVINVTPEARDAFKVALKPIYTQFAPLIGQDIVSSLIAR